MIRDNLSIYIQSAGQYDKQLGRIAKATGEGYAGPGWYDGADGAS